MAELHLRATLGPIIKEEEREADPLKSDQVKRKWKLRSLRSRWEIPLIRSKGAILVLLWNALVFGYQLILLNLFLSTNSLIQSSSYSQPILLMVYFVLSPILYPVAGWLADVHYGRHAVMRYSMFLMWVGSLVLLLGQFIVSMILLKEEDHDCDMVDVADVVEDISFAIVFTLNIFSLAGFHSNVIPFGMDQMPDSSTEQLKSFIRWYYWTRNIGVTVNMMVVFVVAQVVQCRSTGANENQCRSTGANENETGGQFYRLLSLITSAFFITIALSLDFVFSEVLNKDHKKQNPMQVVKKVLLYTVKHKRPVRRSAFTFNPSFNPTRIDYAMSYFGGPFTFEQVENVKTFLNMLKMITIFGCFVFLQTGVRFSIQYFLNQLDESSSLLPRCKKDDDFLSTSLLYWLFNPPFIVIAIPLFEWLIYPLFIKRNCFPSTLKRIGVAICVSLAAAAIFFSLQLDIVIKHDVSVTNNSSVAFNNSNVTECYNCSVCMFLTTVDDDDENRFHLMNGSVPLLPIIVDGIAEMIGNIGAFEFICAQSPYSMRGFMIGAFYFLSGIFSLFALFLITMFTVAFRISPYPNCGLGYYGTLMLIGVGALILYTFVAYRYKKRSRQHIENEQQVIEACYDHNLDDSNEQEDEFIDLSISSQATHTDLDRF